jgi:deferrochelatase/peroxidase EfeB
VHFGYRDGISQPRIEGAPGRQLDDMQPPRPAGDFLLGAGLVNSWGGNHLGGIPPALGDNGIYAAFRILEQDCAGFEAMLDRWAAEFSVDREWLAAKLMGRWRSGPSLATHPERPDPVPAESELNRFDYAPSPEHPMHFDDLDGERCPAGSHVRRLNPRSAPAMGLRGTRRLIRRGMPYGAPYDPDRPDDGIERGLIGLFMCADLELQYEFVLRVWANQDVGAPGLRGTREPILGAQPGNAGHFLIPVRDRRQEIVLSGLPTLTRTRGSVYCLMPGLGGLRHLSEPA